ncbi:MAG: TolC family protein [Candidatus Sulfotelmatobacter sp.]|jgi:outer membrane protein TolC
MIRKRSSFAGVLWLLLGELLFLPAALLAEPLALKRAVELALQHSNGTAIAVAEQKSASAGYRDLRDNFLPQIVLGSGLGPSYGYPLALAGSAPAIFNVTAQSALFHPELQSYIHSAHSEFAAAGFRSKDERNQIIQDTVLTYAELEKWEQRVDHLREVYPDVQKMEAAVSERVKEGIDSELDETRARLSKARMRLRMAEAQGSVDVLREHLAKLTGLPAAGIQTEGDTLPAFPAAAADEGAPERAANDSPAFRAAIEHARAQYLRAQGEHRMWMPSIDFAAQYAELSTFNNYQNYFEPAKPCATSIGTLLCPAGTFQRSNATLGVSIRVPLFNGSQRARAQAAEADAEKARQQADAVHNQASEETLRLQRTVTQMEAARDVAELEYEIAQKGVQTVETRLKSGGVNLHDLDNARTQENEKLIALQDVTFELERNQVELLRSTGDLESWALGTK